MAEPASWMAVATVVSTMFQIAGANEASNFQETQAKDKEDFLKKQRVLIQESKERDLDLFERQVAQLVGRQEANYGMAGVEYSDSALRYTQETLDRAEEEKINIEKQADANISLADYKIASAAATKDFYRDIGPMQTAGLLIGMTGQLAYYGMSNKNFWSKAGQGLTSIWQTPEAMPAHHQRGLL